MTRPRLLLATESPTDRDAIARFLRTVPWLEIVAEVTDLASLHSLVPLPDLDCVLVNDRLPGNREPEATLRSLAELLPTTRFVRIAPASILPHHPLPRTVTLAGSFSADVLVEAILSVSGTSPVIAVGGTLPGCGTTSTVIVLAYAILAALPLGTVVLLDHSERRLLERLWGRHPILSEPRFTQDGRGAVTLIDLGCLAEPPAMTTKLLAVTPKDLRSLAARDPIERFGRSPDALLVPPEPSPLVTGRRPSPRLTRRYLPYLSLLQKKGRDLLGTSPTQYRPSF